MKKITTLLWLASLAIGLNAETLTQRFFIDFGKNDVANGNITTSPDANGNHWTNVSDPALNVTTPLKNATGTVTTYNIVNTKVMTANGIQNGGLTAPVAASFGNYNEMAIATATQDYFYNGTTSPGAFKLTGLDPNKQYRFGFFGSRGGTVWENRITQYVVNGANSFTGTNQTTFASGAINYNNGVVLLSDMIRPTANGEITIDVSATSGAYWHLNVMGILEYATATAIPETESSDIQVYPRTFDQNITVVGAKELVEIYNINGVKVASQPASSDCQINTTSLAKGVYCLVVDKTKSYKVIK